jgi:NAD(P)-dependent dehydrogenase (short-subunit alcohol dehydrogenase family)
MKNKKVWLITGCSSGLGEALAKVALEAGNQVVVTSRNTDKIRELAIFGGKDALVIPLDVRDQNSVTEAVAKAVAHFGRIDILVNNAGYGYYTLFEQLEMEQVYQQMDTNLYGVIRTMQAVLPFMREQKSGHIINISSIAGSMGMAGRSAYSASKFALAGLSESLAAEVSEFGINITVIEPGALRTKFFEGSQISFSQGTIPQYNNLLSTLNAQVANMHGHQKGDPIKAARFIVELTESDTIPLRIPLGADAVTLLDKRIKRQREELSTWRDKSINISFEDGLDVNEYVR